MNYGAGADVPQKGYRAIIFLKKEFSRKEQE